MGTRLGAILATSVALSAVCGSALAHAGGGCTPSGSHLLASDHAGAVFSRGGAVYACDTHAGSRIKLGSASSCVQNTRVDRAALAGTVMAYGAETCGVDTGGASVLVRRLASGKRLKRYAAATTGVTPESYQSVSMIVVRRDGAVAWISVVNSIIGRGTTVAVYADGSLLDSGPGVGPHSLRLQGTKLSWRHGSVLRTATL